MVGKVENLNVENFDNFMKEGNVIVDFYADWCGPCKTMAPEFEKASEENSSVKFGKVNIESNQELAERFSVMSIPTIILLKNGEQVNRYTGPLRAEEIKEMFDKTFS